MLTAIFWSCEKSFSKTTTSVSSTKGTAHSDMPMTSKYRKSGSKAYSRQFKNRPHSILMSCACWLLRHRMKSNTWLWLQQLINKTITKFVVKWVY